MTDDLIENYTPSEIAHQTFNVASQNDFSDSTRPFKFSKVGKIKLSDDEIEKHIKLWNYIKIKLLEKEVVSPDVFKELEDSKSIDILDENVVPVFENALNNDRDFCQEIQKKVQDILSKNYLKNNQPPKYFFNLSLKDRILIAWLLLLIVISTLALGGAFSALFESISDLFTSNFLKLSGSNRIVLKQEMCQSKEPKTDAANSKENSLVPRDLLRCYIQNKYENKFLEEVPPIGRILDDLEPKYWNDIDGSLDNLTESDYNGLFEIIDKYLIAISSGYYEDVNGLRINTSILPAKFRTANKSILLPAKTRETDKKTIIYDSIQPIDPTGKTALVNKFVVEDKPLPLAAKNWIIIDRTRRDELKLVDTFFIVLMLGALGSIIFLVREHMLSTEAVETRLYFYRPVFGMLLAIGSFVISISLSGILAEGKFQEINLESVITIAFASGLISDAVYQNLRRISSENYTKS